MKDTLKSLPTGLKAYDQAYNEAMERITGQDLDTKELAKQVLSCVSWGCKLGTAKYKLLRCIT
jgi:hypothetical protein